MIEPGLGDHMEPQPDGSTSPAPRRTPTALTSTAIYYLSTGMIGTNALVEALPRHGRADVLYRMADRTTFPSWGHMLERGATTLWESWSDDPGQQLSLNMKLLGSVDKFF